VTIYCPHPPLSRGGGVGYLERKFKTTKCHARAEFAPAGSLNAACDVLMPIPMRGFREPASIKRRGWSVVFATYLLVLHSVANPHCPSANGMSSRMCKRGRFEMLTSPRNSGGARLPPLRSPHSPLQLARSPPSSIVPHPLAHQLKPACPALSPTAPPPGDATRHTIQVFALPPPPPCPPLTAMLLGCSLNVGKNVHSKWSPPRPPPRWNRNRLRTFSFSCATSPPSTPPPFPSARLLRYSAPTPPLTRLCRRRVCRCLLAAKTPPLHPTTPIT